MIRGLVCALAAAAVCAKTIDFEAAGAKANDDDLATELLNGALLNASFAALKPGDVLVIPNRTYHVMGGIIARNLRDVTISIDGTLKFSERIDAWPTSPDGTGGVLQCLFFDAPSNVTWTSAGEGTLDGQGAVWWGIPGVGYLERGENRPRIFQAQGSPKNLLVERLRFINSPYWTFWVDGVDGLEVRYSHIDNRRSPKATTHSGYELTAFNTDGYDVTGKNVWIHDSSVWCQDDGIAVKDGSENMLFENMDVSGLGMTIGSIGGSTVRNITFRNIRSRSPYKGIYLKHRSDGGHIEDVTYENIVLDAPEQYAIWIGPAQQADDKNPCAAHPCSLCWPTLPFAKCDAPVAFYKNILLRNITINDPKNSLGVVLGNANSSMVNVTFDDVVVNNPADNGHFGKAQYYCGGVASGVATGKTNVVPPCFTDRTSL